MARTRPARSVLLTLVLAVLVIAGSLVTVAVLRPHAQPGASGQPATTGAPDPGCPPERCRLVATAKVRDAEVGLLADPASGSTWLRMGGVESTSMIETSIATEGVTLGEESLRCVAAVATSACLVRGPRADGVAGEVLTSRGGGWRTAARPYFSNAGMIWLDDVSGNDAPEVIVLQHDCSAVNVSSCGKAPVVGTVFALAGAKLGCTRRYGWPAQLPGWPNVELSAQDILPCG